MTRQKNRGKVIGSRRNRKQARKQTPLPTDELKFSTTGIDPQLVSKLAGTVVQRRHVVDVKANDAWMTVQVSLVGVEQHRKVAVLSALKAGIARDIKFRIDKSVEITQFA